jgi:hypothetical protein
MIEKKVISKYGIKILSAALGYLVVRVPLPPQRLAIGYK